MDDEDWEDLEDLMESQIEAAENHREEDALGYNDPNDR